MNNVDMDKFLVHKTRQTLIMQEPKDETNRPAKLGTGHSLQKALLTIVILTATGFLINDAYADIPNIDTFVADDPDDGDTVYSNGDTFTLTFSLPINVTASASMSQGAIDGNFTMSGGATFGTTYSGQWDAGRQTLTITVSNVAGAIIPTIDATTISASGGSNLGHAGDLPTSSTLTGTPTLSGDFGVVIAVNDGGGSGCNGDCTEPTLGIDENGIRLVENGFVYNGKPVNVERYFTPYPLITVNVGTRNLAEFKIFDENGPQNISHFDLAFGLASGQTLSQSKAMIEWDRTFDGSESVNVVDPDNLLSDNTKVLISEGKCREDSLTDDCLIVKVYHTFKAPPEFNIVGTNTWDSYRNSWQNYYNHGIKVVGESMNPPKSYLAVDKGNLVTITEVEKNHAVDKDGNHWVFDKEWIKEYVPKGKIADPISKYHGIERNHAYFQTYLEGQQLVASHTLEQILGGKPIQGESPKESPSYDYKRVSRSDNVDLQNAIKLEMTKAQQTYETMYRMKS